MNPLKLHIKSIQTLLLASNYTKRHVLTNSVWLLGSLIFVLLPYWYSVPPYIFIRIENLRSHNILKLILMIYYVIYLCITTFKNLKTNTNVSFGCVQNSLYIDNWSDYSVQFHTELYVIPHHYVIKLLNYIQWYNYFSCNSILKSSFLCTNVTNNDTAHV